ncbi:Ovalbumin [Pteropus alecto]|uniref:Ovalbumin n=1 Tax=Pteropus alecto TaxID=9402 RepID=L5KK05_PTEAL|nr:Ovalbumin [Pteropus alecto]
MGSLSAANAHLCFDVFKEMSYDHTTENLVFSPLGLLSALALVLFGARGDSASQMEKCEHDTGVHSHIQAFLSEINRFGHSQVHMASGIFAEAAHPFLPKYLDCIEQLYKLKPENLDFKNNLEEARMRINSWIENKTNGEIKGLLPHNSLVASDQLVLSQSKAVQMMRLEGYLKLGSVVEPRVQLLELPDAEDCLSMVILLPSEDIGLGQVTREITYEKLKHWLNSASMKDTGVVLYLPRLRVDERHEDLTSILTALGLIDVFDHSRANLSGLTAGGGLAVSTIIHKAMLEVTEGHSEITPTTQTSTVENPEIFKVDRPFLFFILHKETWTILFYGRISNL